jgi:hypothetical protein
VQEGQQTKQLFWCERKQSRENYPQLCISPVSYATTNSYEKTPQTYKQRRDFDSEIFLHPDDFFLDNFRGGDYEMLLALPAEKK